MSDPNRLSKETIMTELEKRNIDYEDKENKCELVARLRKNIGEETQRRGQRCHSAKLGREIIGRY